VIRVLVSSQSSVRRAGLESLVTASATLMLVGSSPGVATAVFAQQINDLQPDVMLVDLGGQDDEAIVNLLALGTKSQTLATVALMDITQGSWAVEALHSGLRAILPREALAEEIVAAVEAAAAGLIVLHQQMIELLLSMMATIPQEVPTAQPETLTPREVEVLRMIAEGIGNKTIAHRLGISEHTVKFHVSSIFAKLGATSRTEAVTLGIRRGLIML
jgi:two-component system, NarL family, response regulator YdfI